LKPLTGEEVLEVATKTGKMIAKILAEMVKRL
ncbi:MAG TPA: purine-nucleoside phosphorylase, partial [Fervidobacterium sp.]|nr:purine-nucleoside phosphorylase [Fervidobacterium sp.]